MAVKRKKSEEIRRFILANVARFPSAISNLTATYFEITQPAVSKHLNKLIDEGLLTAEGKTKAREYKLVTLEDSAFQIPITSKLQEYSAWEKNILPLLGEVDNNVRSICLFGFTEMLNNAIDHSGSKDAIFMIQRNAANIEINVWDTGVGIFNKIQKAFDLEDPRHALLELSKGKLTTDSENHSGEGIFFTSRIFDKFSILSDSLFYSRTNMAKPDDWLMEIEDHQATVGTRITMEISPFSENNLEEIYSRHAAKKDDFGFSSTHVPIQLMRYEGDHLVSRSQAKRLLHRFDLFKEVFLDFKGISTIGQAFADEVFRIYRKAHPEIRVVWVNTNPEIERMIAHVLAEEDDDLKQISLF